MPKHSDIEDAAPSFCIPADGLHLAGCRWSASQRCCPVPECPALFTPPGLRARQRSWRAQPQPPLLVIVAGPERSGSTWQYNAVRLLFERAQQPLDSFFVGDLLDALLDARGAGSPGRHHVLIKTHRWSQAWSLDRASHVFVTHRDLRQVVASYRRLGWASWLPRGYCEDHMRWKAHAELDQSFEDITQRPEAALQELAERLGLAGRVDCRAVLAELSALPVPEQWMDPVTQIWPSHLSGPFLEARHAAVQDGSSSSSGGGGSRGAQSAAAGADARTGGRGGGRGRLSEAEAARLQQQHAEFQSMYGYA